MSSNSNNEKYFLSLEKEIERLTSIAKRARSRGIDPYTDVEIKKANELHERIVALFPIESLGERVRYWLGKTDNKVEIAFRIISEIIPRSGEEAKIPFSGNDEERAELALRVGMAIITDATVSAPIEGISYVKIKGSGRDTYLSVYYNGPIRTAGGTEGAISVLMADYIRQRLGLGRYIPTHEEIERYVEEVFLYKRIVHLQYNSEPEEVRNAVKNIPIEVTGPPTEKEEVSSFRNLPRVETNRIRGGAVLVINDCIIQKAKKLKKIIEKLKEALDFDDSYWKWISGESINAEEKMRGSESGCPAIEPSYKYLKDAVMGRPIIAYPSRPGGFRLRYGRSRNTGLASIGVSPATMYILESFMAVGTQVRIERPGKSAVVMPVDWLEGPIVRLANGTVVKVNSVQDAIKLADRVEKILHLGDVLIGFGEFLENNHVLLPSAWVEEWWYSLLRKKSEELGIPTDVDRWEHLSLEEAIDISKKYDIPLHPKFTYYWEDITVEELLSLTKAISSSIREEDGLIMKLDGDVKQILEAMGVPHEVSDGHLRIEGDHAKLLSYISEKIPSELEIENTSSYSTLEVLNSHLDFKIMPKGPTRIGMRIGRPEKAKPRKMKPPVNLLFPVGELKGMSRSLALAYSLGKITVEVSLRKCPKCGAQTTNYSCPKCGTRTISMRFCPYCGRPVNGRCPNHPNVEPVPYTTVRLNIKEEVERALANLGEDHSQLENVKGVKGLTSGSKSPEIIEKGILRGKYGLFVFKDGTTRFDAVNAALTHFKPKEIGVSVSKLIELGYTHDIFGQELINDDQILELKVQDIVIPRKGAEYLFRVSKYIDELLEKVYGLEPFYKLQSEEDLVGHLVLTISPHTFVANVARIIGFTEADVLFAHPFLHAAKRRNVDGDEDSIMLVLDALINFSREFLPSTPGGREDAPLILVTRIDPDYIDDEVYNMEVTEEFPPEFYEATYRFEDPHKLKSIVRTVEHELASGIKYPSINFTIPTTHIAGGPLQTMYRKLNKMSEKLEAHFGLEEKIRAVDRIDALSRAISSHFLRDIVGNLRKFGQQTFRCTKCNAKYRRPPISGKCLKCGGPIQLTVHKGTVLKYLEPTIRMVRRYGLEGYLSQRIRIIYDEAKSLFREVGVGRESRPTTLEEMIEVHRGSNEEDNELKAEREGEKAPRRLVDFL